MSLWGFTACGPSWSRSTSRCLCTVWAERRWLWIWACGCARPSTSRPWWGGSPSPTWGEPPMLYTLQFDLHCLICSFTSDLLSCLLQEPVLQGVLSHADGGEARLRHGGRSPQTQSRDHEQEDGREIRGIQEDLCPQVCSEHQQGALQRCAQRGRLAPSSSCNL